MRVRGNVLLLLVLTCCLALGQPCLASSGNCNETNVLFLIDTSGSLKKTNPWQIVQKIAAKMGKRHHYQAIEFFSVAQHVPLPPQGQPQAWQQVLNALSGQVPNTSLQRTKCCKTRVISYTRTGVHTEFYRYVYTALEPAIDLGIEILHDADLYPDRDHTIVFLISDGAFDEEWSYIIDTDLSDLKENLDEALQSTSNVQTVFTIDPTTSPATHEEANLVRFATPNYHASIKTYSQKLTNLARKHHACMAPVKPKKAEPLSFANDQE